MTDKKYMRLVCYEGEEDSAYLELQDHPHELVFGIVGRTEYLHELIKDYNGPKLLLQFDKENRPIGIEILYPYQDEEQQL